MIRAALFAFLAGAFASAAEASPVLVSTERPYAPNAAGAVVKIEVQRAGTVDVRLYRLPDPERFFSSQRDVRHVAVPDGSPAATARVHEPLSVLERAAARSLLDLRQALDLGLSPAARAIAKAAVHSSAPSGRPEAPFLGDLPLVERWELACGAGDSDFAYCDLDLGPRPAGAYLVEAINAGSVAHAVALFTQLALVARRTGDELAILAVDVPTGRGLSGVQLSLLAPGQPPIQGVTKRQGIFTTRAPSGPALLIGRQKAQVALVELSAPVSPAQANSALVWTDRGEYRPGERVLYHGLARVDRLGIPKAATVEVSAYDARGSLFFRDTRPLSDEGGFDGELLLPTGLAQGLWQLTASVEDLHSDAELVVREAPVPAFEVQVSLSGQAGKRAGATVEATANGRPVPGASLSWRALRFPLDAESGGSPEEVDRGEAETDSSGRAGFFVETPGDRDGRYELSVVARDAEGRVVVAETSARLLRGTFALALRPEKRVVPPAEAVSLRIHASDAAARPVSVEIQARVFAVRGTAESSAKTRILETSLRTGPDGSAVLSFTPMSAGYYEIDASHQGRRLAETYLYVTTQGGDIPFTPGTLTLVPDRSSYRPGETARILVLAPFDSAATLLTAEAGSLLETAVVNVRGSSAVYSLKLTEAMAPSFVVSAQAVVGEHTWHRERRVKVAANAAALLLQGVVERSGEGELLLRMKVTDRAGRPSSGAELQLVARDPASFESPAPALADFFFPEPTATGATESSTAYRNSSSGRTPILEAMDGAFEEGFAPFKGEPQGRPRARDAGTVAFLTSTTDAAGGASFRIPLPADVPQVALTVRAARRAAFGEWRELARRPVGPVALTAPRFLREGDEAVATLSAGGPGTPIGANLTWGDESEDGDGDVSLALEGRGEDRLLVARLHGLGELRRSIRIHPNVAIIRSGTSGLAVPGRSRLPAAAEGEQSVLHLAASPVAAVRAARVVLGEQQELMTSGAIARLLASTARLRLGDDPHARALGQLDAARLVALAHPEGRFGAFDGAPPDPDLTAYALTALQLARRAGLDLDARLLARGTERLRGRDDPLAAWALALNGELPPQQATRLAEWDRHLERIASEHALVALALAEAGQAGPARSAAERAARALASSPSLACPALTCTAVTSRAQLAAVALSVIALEKTGARPGFRAALLRYLLHQRQQGDFGADAAGGFAVLALTGTPASGSAGVTVTVEAAGKALGTFALDRFDESSLPVPGTDVSVLVRGGPALWRLERAAESSRPGRGPLKVTRTYARPSGEEGPIHVGDPVLVTLRIEASEAVGAIRIDDPFPAGLEPVEQVGSRNPLLELDPTARRIVLEDRVVLLLSSLPKGTTELRWRARAAVVGTFAAASVRADAGDLWGRSSSTELAIEEMP